MDTNIFNERDLDVIHTDKPITKVLDVLESGTQTPLSLSSTSPRKVYLYQQIKGYKKRMANLKLELHEAKKAKKEDINTLDILLDKYFPKQTSEFLKIQFKYVSFKRMQKVKDTIALHSNNIVYLYIFQVLKYIYKYLANKSKLFCLPSCTTLKRFTQNCYIQGVP